MYCPPSKFIHEPISLTNYNKFNLKEDFIMNRFFMGKAIGTIIVFTLLGIYLLLKYVLHIL